MNAISKKLGICGDTIVEVLVVLAVLGLAISISYESANSALLDTSAADENAQASKYVNSEIEYLRSLAPNSNKNDRNQDPNGNIFNSSVPYCITNTTPSAPIITTTSSLCNFGTVPYHVLIYNCDSYQSDSPDPCLDTIADSDTFVVQATWPGTPGDVTDSTSTIYRIHVPGEASSSNSSAGIGPGPCDPTDPNCEGGPTPGGSYDWSDEFQNISPAGQDVIGCSWNWGDGTVTNNQACNTDDTIDHTFVSQPTPDPYPTDCQKYPYTVILTVNLANGLNPTSTYEDDLPTCD